MHFIWTFILYAATFFKREKRIPAEILFVRTTVYRIPRKCYNFCRCLASDCDKSGNFWFCLYRILLHYYAFEWPLICIYSPVNPLFQTLFEMLLDPKFISSLRSERKMADKSDFATRRAASREKHGPELRNIFKQVDKDNSGYASIDEMW